MQAKILAYAGVVITNFTLLAVFWPFNFHMSSHFVFEITPKKPISKISSSTGVQPTITPTTETNESLLENADIFENSCKIPILDPLDCSLAGLTDPPNLRCPTEDPMASQDSDGYLVVKKRKGIQCAYRGIHPASALLPEIKRIDYIDDWQNISEEHLWVRHQQYTVRCLHNGGRVVFEEAFFHTDGEAARQNYLPSSLDRLSIDLIVLESVAANQVRRHLKNSWAYMRDELGFIDFHGYNKVSDNSLVNIHPLLTGQRFRGMSESDPVEKPTPAGPINVEEISDWLWESEMRGCASLYNSDPTGDFEVYFYPESITPGLRRPIATHFTRASALLHTKIHRLGLLGLTCGNLKFGLSQLNIQEEFMRKLKDRCHFGYTRGPMSILHERSRDLEAVDAPLLSMLKRLEADGALNRSLVVIVGDHGQRVGPIAKTQVGRVEERAPFLALRFPPAFALRHPALIQALEYNRQRLTTNFDLHKLLRDVAAGEFDGAEHWPDLKGISLFQPIPAQRNCSDADIPRRYCTCMEPFKGTGTPEQVEEARLLLRNYTRRFNCTRQEEVKILRSQTYNINQEVAYGIIYMNEKDKKKLEKPPTMDLEYLELVGQLTPSGYEILARFQVPLKPIEKKCGKRLRLNGEPLLTKGSCKVNSLSQLCRHC